MNPTEPTTPTVQVEPAPQITVTPDPDAIITRFEGWGTSLAWFANALGDLGERRYSDDPDIDAKAKAYGDALRRELFDAIFSRRGLGLNMARYNIGGGNASDVAYGYPFMRPGAAVPGYWRADPDGTAGVYGGVTTTRRDKDALARAFDPDDERHYDWDAGRSQEWWIAQGAATGAIDHWECFANSAPWFMTASGYATGGFDANDDNLADPERFARYLAHCVDHLRREYGIHVDSVDALNEPEPDYWRTPAVMAADAMDDAHDPDGRHRALIARYPDVTDGKDLRVTPYSTETHKPQEGMRVSGAMQCRIIPALRRALDERGVDARVAGSDATKATHFVESYEQWDEATRRAVGQYNVHAYAHDGQERARAIAAADGRPLSMSEVDASWSHGGFDPYDFDNAIGIAREINHDVYTLASKDFTFWQVVEDLYNQSMPADGELNPRGEDSNWGMLLVDFDPDVAGADGVLHSRRRRDDNGGTLTGLEPCRVRGNVKYNGMRAYTAFVREGSAIIANDDMADTFTALSADGGVLTVIHTNADATPRRLRIDLGGGRLAGRIVDARAYMTGELDGDVRRDGRGVIVPPTLDELLRCSAVEQADAAVVDDARAHVDVDVPARTIASVVVRIDRTADDDDE